MTLSKMALHMGHTNNKANLWDWIAATGLVIVPESDKKYRVFRPCDLEIWAKSSVFQPVWPRNLTDDLEKTLGHPFYSTSSLVHYFKAIGEFKLSYSQETLDSGQNWQFCPMWYWTLTDDL